jgi:hypothetical protein
VAGHGSERGRGQRGVGSLGLFRKRTGGRNLGREFISELLGEKKLSLFIKKKEKAKLCLFSLLRVMLSMFSLFSLVVAFLGGGGGAHLISDFFSGIYSRGSLSLVLYSLVSIASQSHQRRLRRGQRVRVMPRRRHSLGDGVGVDEAGRAAVLLLHTG